MSTVRIRIPALILALALFLGGLPAFAAAKEDSSLLSGPRFWRASLGAGAGAMLATKALGWTPVLTALSSIAEISPFAALMARPMLPVLAGAIGAQLVSRGLAHADWAMVAAQTVGGALGTALALVAVPGSGLIVPMLGEIIGTYAGTSALRWFRGRHAANGGPALAVFGVPAIHSAASTTHTPLQDAYEHLVSASHAGATTEVKQAYANVVQLAH